MNIVILDRMRILIQRGPELLSSDEQGHRFQEHRPSASTRSPWSVSIPYREFWRLQKETLDEPGCSIYDARFARAVVAKLLDVALNPKTTTEKAVRRAKRSRRRVRAGDATGRRVLSGRLERCNRCRRR